MSTIVDTTPPPNVGATMRLIRTQRKLSLDETSRLTGVSKAMLGQIERGESSPTVSTLWKISTGLQVSFSTLMEPQTHPLPASRLLVNAQAIPPIFEAKGGMILRDLFPFDPAAGFEVFHITVKPGCRYTSPSHHNVVEEYVLVTKGTLTLHVEDECMTLKEGMAVKFPGPAQHTYANEHQEEAVFHNIIRY